MLDNISPVESEIADHVIDIDNWVDDVEKMNTPTSRIGVRDRFIRDCKLFREDVGTHVSPTVYDLVDFVDRHNSLEIQYRNILSDLS